jgi:hypothetical protein
MAIGKYFGWLRFAPIWVGLMSGSFSIFREAIALFSQNPSPFWQRNVFWACVWTTCVLSLILAWYLERRERINEQVKNTLPEIVGEIKRVGVSAFDDYFLSVESRITSNRAETTISDFSLTVTYEGHTYEGVGEPVKEYYLEREIHHPAPFETTTETRYFPLEDLAKDNRVPFTRGASRTGWLRFLVRGVKPFSGFATAEGKEQFLKEGVKLVLTVYDGYGNPHPITYVSHGASQSVAIKRIPDVGEWTPLTPYLR